MGFSSINKAPVFVKRNMTSTYDSFGRINQKQRTRTALKAAATELIRQGETPTMAQIAAKALVAKSTAYRYFPTQEALLAEVLLDTTIAPELAAVYRAAQTSGSAAARLEAVVRADHALVVKHQQAFRTALRVMLITDTDDASEIPRRPGNRLRYISDALAPIKDQLGSERLERLVMALSLCVGMESILVLQDICGLTSAAAEKLKFWTTAALLEAALNEVTSQER
jgi:AcrR family transcriptional regulator